MLKILRSLQHQVNLQLKKKRSMRLLMIRLGKKLFFLGKQPEVSENDDKEVAAQVTITEGTK